MDTSSSDDGMRGDAREKHLPVRKPEIAQIIEVASTIPQPQSPDWLQTQVRRLQEVTARPPSALLRRLLLFWLRIYVYEDNAGKTSQVNLRVPVPLPIIGAFFRRHLTWDQAVRIVTLSQQEPNGGDQVSAYLGSCMALEFIRVEESKPGKKAIVVIGLD